MTNPILAFGAKQRMRSIRTPILLTVYALLLTALSVIAVYMPFLSPSTQISAMRGSFLGYVLMLILQFGLLVLVAPAITAGSICGERERQTLDLLLVTNTSAAQIVLGKLLESFAFLALVVLCSMPTLALILLTGGATFGQLMMSILFLLVTALAGLSVGLCCSAFLKRTASATVVSYLVMLGIGIITFVPLWYDVHRIDMLYRVLNQAGRPMVDIDYQAISFSLNPALGLFDLLTVQMSFFNSLLYPFSHTLASTVAYLPFERYLITNIAFMAVASVGLCLLATLKLKVKRPKQRKVSVNE